MTHHQMTTADQPFLDPHPPWTNFDVVLVHVDDAGLISVVGQPRKCGRSMYLTFAREIEHLLIDPTIVGANLLSVVVCHAIYETLPANRAASLLSQHSGFIGGEALIVIKKSAFETFWRNNDGQFTISADLCSEDQAS